MCVSRFHVHLAVDRCLPAELQVPTTLYDLPCQVTCHHETLRTPNTFPSLFALRPTHRHPIPTLERRNVQHHIPAIRSRKTVMANFVVNHITAGTCRTMAQLKSQCAVEGGPPVLCLFVGSRARVLRFDLCDNFQHRKNFDDFHTLLQKHLLNDNQYRSLQVMRAATTALKAAIVVWV